MELYFKSKEKIAFEFVLFKKNKNKIFQNKVHIGSEDIFIL